MKKIATIIIVFLITGLCTAQSTGFVAMGGRLVWENVFISSETNIPAIISRHSRLKIVSAKGQVYKGVATGVGSSCEGTSKNLKSEYNFNFEIELSEGKYRVSISNIVFAVKKKTAIPAEKYYIAAKELKLSALNTADLACMDAYFNKIFSMTLLYKSRS